MKKTTDLDVLSEVRKLAETGVCIGNTGPFACLCRDCTRLYAEMSIFISKEIDEVFKITTPNN